MIKRDPENPIGYYELAQHLNYQKSFEEAIENLNKAISLDPQFEAAWQLRAQIYRERQDYSRAAVNAQEVLRINPNNYKATYLLGRAFYKMNMLGEALECFEKCEKLEPTIVNHRSQIREIKELMAHKGLKPLNLDSFEGTFSEGDLIRIKEALESAPILTDEMISVRFSTEEYESPMVGPLEKVMFWLSDTLIADSKLGINYLSAVWVDYEIVNIVRSLEYSDETENMSSNILLAKKSNNEYCVFTFKQHS